MLSEDVLASLYFHEWLSTFGLGFGRILFCLKLNYWWETEDTASLFSVDNMKSRHFSHYLRAKEEAWQGAENILILLLLPNLLDLINIGFAIPLGIC